MKTFAVSVFAIAGLISMSCSHRAMVQSSISISKPVEKESFIAKPFGYEPTVKNFKANLPSYKLQVYTMKNIHNHSIIDTIYKFHRRKDELLIYKNVNNIEMFFAGRISSDKIKLKNGVRVGMSRDEFYKSFTNLRPKAEDTVRISSKRAPNSFNFIFKGNKLIMIKIDNYID
jgi:hypothetical protein